MKGTELIIAEKLNVEVLFTKEGELEKAMSMIRQKVDEFEPDLETAAGRKEIASMSRKVSSSKTFLDGIRKAQNAEAKAQIDGRNGLWKPAREELDELRDKARKPLTDYESEQELLDQERIAKIKDQIDSWVKSYYELNATGSIDELKEYISKLETIKELISPELYFEFTTEAFQTASNLIEKAKQDLETRIRLDTEEAERKAEAERQAKVAKEQAEETARLKAEQDRIATEQAEAQAKIDAAQKKIDDQNAALEAKKREEQERKDREQFERDAKIKAEADAKAAAEKAETDRLAKIESDRVEAERQEALLPDREKLQAFSQFLEEMNYPSVTSEEGRQILRTAESEILEIAKGIFEATQTM